MVQTKQKPLISREYLRVSIDRSGRVRSHEEQHNDNIRDAERQGWRLADQPYRDLGSASRYARRRRDGFDELMADLEADQFGADVLQLWESSRGSRKVGDWVTLLDLMEKRRVRIWVHTHDRIYDPANHRDRRSLIDDANDSEYEAAKISDRSRRAAAASGANGAPYGPTPYGYRRIYDVTSGRLLEQVPHPDEAPLVREFFRRVLSGESLRSITIDFEKRGIRNDSGGPFSSQHLRNWASNPTYAGWRIHDPGRRGTRRLSEAATKVDAQWEKLVSRADFLAVQMIINDPARKTNRDGGARHLLSMIGRCDVCSAPIAVRNRRGGEEYRCHNRGCVTVDKVELDRLAENLIVGYLADPQLYKDLAQRDDVQNEELAAVRDKLVEVRAELADLAAKVVAGELSLSFAASVEPGLLARKATLEDREKALSAPSALRRLIHPGQDAANRWATATPEVRRATARAVFSAELFGELRVKRSPAPRSRLPVTARVTGSPGSALEAAFRAAGV